MAREQGAPHRCRGPFETFSAPARLLRVPLRVAGPAGGNACATHVLATRGLSSIATAERAVAPAQACVEGQGLGPTHEPLGRRSPAPHPPPLPAQVRIVDAIANAAEAAVVMSRDLEGNGVGNSPLSPSPHGGLAGGAKVGSFARVGSITSNRSLPRPAFGSSPSLSGLGDDEGSESNVTVPCFEVTIASKDQSKLLSRLSNALGDLGLNIREAHAFNTKDGFSLDVFVVDGWSLEALEGLEDALADKFGVLFSAEQGGVQLQQPPAWMQQQAQFEAERREASVATAQEGISGGAPAAGAGAPPAADDWELNPEQLQLTSIIGSGSFGDLYKGYHAGSEVAVKILKDVHENVRQFQEFLQEVAIMRKVRHKNVVQFIGACTRVPNLCIVFEYMQGGSVFDYIRRQGPLSVDQVVRVGVEVARGMDYLHQMHIVHRDLKAANLLMDEHGTVKIADFGVARVVTQGVMTAETGTYRWMAPEVIEHRPYSHKADVFSFGVLLWELITGKVPHGHLTPLQAAVGVVQKGLRPPLPETLPPALADLMRACWRTQPEQRPEFAEVAQSLLQLQDSLMQLAAKKSAGGLFARFRRSSSARPPQAGGVGAGSGGGSIAGLAAQGSGIPGSVGGAAPMHIG